MTPEMKISGRSLRNLRSHAPIFQVYWILKRWGGSTAAQAAAWGVSTHENPMPHEGLCASGHVRPQELMKELRAKGWKPSQFTGSKEQCFAKIEVTAGGFNLVCFSSYATALADHRARAQKPIPQNPNLNPHP